MTFPDEFFWNDKYTTGSLGWDIGEVSAPLKTYFDQLTDKYVRILIPGAGNAYEAEYLHCLGFKNVWVVDIAQEPLTNLLQRVPGFPADHLIKGDFFELQMKMDLIIEQTFFCSLHPSLRPKYVHKMHQLLVTGGQLVGVLFNDPLYTDRPPFGGNIEEYKTHFEGYFNSKTFEMCYNSILRRKNREVFINLIKREEV